jgi:MFS family permease
MGTFRDAVDAKALRFALGFPVLLAAAFVVCAVLLRPDLPEPLAVLWTSDGVTGFAPFPAFVGVGSGLIVILSWLVLLQAVPVSRPVIMRRIMMGTGISLSLFITAVLAAVLVGQAGVADAGSAQVDAIVLAMGSGFALAMGVVVGFVFKADEQWSIDDDRALEQALEQQIDPDLARDNVRLWVHARSSVFVMLIVATLFPASLIALALPWLSGLLVAVAALLAAFLFARVTADRSGLRVFVAGFVRVMNVPAATISSAAASDVRAAEYGGWGYRSHGDTRAVLVSSGPAVVLKQTDGQRAVVSGGNPDSAQRLAEVLSRVAARARGEGRS